MQVSRWKECEQGNSGEKKTLLKEKSQVRILYLGEGGIKAEGKIKMFLIHTKAESQASR